MKKRSWITLASILALISISIGAWFLFNQPTPSPSSSPAPEKAWFSSFPEAVNWDDREIYKTGLTESAAGVLDDIPLASTYLIALEIPQELGTGLHGHQIVRYFNTEDQQLDQIYFRLFPNYQGGQMRVSSLSVEGKTVTPVYESLETALRVDLADPLLPGESLVLEMDFELVIPTEIGSSSGLFGYYDQVLALDSFYPLIPVYDQQGWYKDYPQLNGDLPYNDASFYLVQVEAPADLVLASSGVVVEQQITEDRQTTLIASGPSRDFYLAGSREYVELSGQVGETRVRIYTKPEYSVNQALALDYALNAIQIFSEQVAPYPYTEFEVISSVMWALGMEYPGITSIVTDEFVAGVDLFGIPSAQMLESTLVHEAGHMWFYNAVGNDQQNQPWVDEALVQYLTYVYYLERYGDGSSYVASWQSRWSRVEYDPIPIGKAAGAYQGSEYSAIVYGRGPLFFLELEKRYGREMVMEAVRDYYQENLWGLGYEHEIQAALEASCACDLSAEFAEWVD